MRLWPGDRPGQFHGRNLNKKPPRYSREGFLLRTLSSAGY